MKSQLLPVIITSRRCRAAGMPRFAEVEATPLANAVEAWQVWIEGRKSQFILGNGQFRFRDTAPTRRPQPKVAPSCRKVAGRGKAVASEQRPVITGDK